MKNIILTCLAIFSTSSSIQALQLDLDLTGISYHIGANDNNPAYSAAPRGLDKNGAFVFGPGFGLGLDFREKDTDPGFSPMFKFIYLRDCDDRDWMMAAFGTRYRHFLTPKISGDVNLALSLINSENWYTGTRNINLNPYLSFGLNYHLENNTTAGFVSSLIPKNKAAGESISGFNILFVSLYFSFPLK